jgi:hypothetical protein
MNAQIIQNIRSIGKSEKTMHSDVMPSACTHLPSGRPAPDLIFEGMTGQVGAGAAQVGEAGTWDSKQKRASSRPTVPAFMLL